MREHDKKIFELLLAEIFKNKIMLEEIERDIFGEMQYLADMPEGIRGETVGDLKKKLAVIDINTALSSLMRLC